MGTQKEQLQRINGATWPSQHNSRSMYLIRDYTEKSDKKRAYVEIFRAYVAQKWPIQAQFAVALTLKPTWVRDHYFPASYAHASWQRLQAFLQLPGRIFWGQDRVEVELKQFNDCALNRDLETLCAKVTQQQPRLPDGRRLLFRVQGRGILLLDAREKDVA